MGKLYLIGTHHYDFNGPDRLFTLLTILKPEVIVTEGTSVPEQALQQRTAMKYQFDQHKNELIREYGEQGYAKIAVFSLTTGYEAWMPAIYAQRNPGVIIIPSHQNKGLLSKIIDIGSNFFAKRLTKIVQTQILEMNFEEVQRDTDKSYNETPDAPKGLNVLRVMHDDKRHAQTLEIHLEQADGNVIGVVGIGHIFAPYENLAKRLRRFNPLCYRLIQADNL